MQKLESSLKNMVPVLVGVALVVGAVLAYVNHITSGPIAQKAEQSLAAGIKSVMGTDDLQVAAPEEVPQQGGYLYCSCLFRQERQLSRSSCREHHRRLWWRPEGTGRFRQRGQDIGLHPSSALRDSRSWCQGQYLVPERRQGQHHWQDTKGWQPAREQGRQEWQCC